MFRKIITLVYGLVLANTRMEITNRKLFDIPEEQDRSVKELMDRYMSEHSKLRKKSWKRDEVSLSHLLPCFGDLCLAEVTPALISRYKTKRLTEKARPATLNRELALLKHSFNIASREWGWCRENPCSRVRMERENNARDRVLAYGEEKNLLNVCPKWLRNIVIFALETGAREGEILDSPGRTLTFSER